ncbi:MAG: hypothetical protein AAF446_09490 [Pseudomonadota bacterium]
MITKLSAALSIVLMAGFADLAAQTEIEQTPTEPEVQYEHWLAERAAESDVIVVAQLERTDYEYRRGFPVEGRTWFRVIFDYKSPCEMERLIVLETGLQDELSCYFPDIPAFNEQPRYLLFLSYDEDNALRGHPYGCAIELAVNKQGQYVAVWPQQGFQRASTDLGTLVPPMIPEIQVPEPEPFIHTEPDATLQSMVKEMVLTGPSSRIDGSQMLAHQRRELAEAEQLRIEGTNLIRTRGIELSELRTLMSAGLRASDEQAERDQQRRIEALRRVLNES